MKKHLIITQLFSAFLLLAMSVSAQTAQFTYQGKLTDMSMAANGTYDFQFSLFDQSGTQIGTTQTITGITVTNGIFTVDLNFGAAAFDGNRRFLQIAVQKPGDPGYTTLAPLQEIKSSPYSIQARNADTLDGVSPGGFVQNTTTQQTADFNISGDGTIGGNLTVDGTLSQSVVNASTQYNLGGQRFISTFNFSTAVGRNTGSSGGTNSFFGDSSGSSNTTGGFNNFFGAASGFGNLSGSENSFFGANTGASNTSGGRNSFFGTQSGTNNTTGGNNTLLGYGANVSAGNLNFATAIGAGAVVSNSDSVVIGRNIDVVRIPGSLIANLPTGDGDYIQNRTTEQTSTNFNISGTGTVGGTFTAGTFNTSTTYRIDNITVLEARGTDNLFVGKTAGALNTVGQRNTFIGDEAGRNNEFGDDNTFVGFNTDVGNVNGQSGNNNTLLGSNASVSFSGIEYGTAIGSDAFVNTSNTIVLGRFSGQDKVIVHGLGAVGSDHLCRNSDRQISFCSSSLRYKSNIQPFDFGLNLVKKLKPITFDWKTDGKADLGLGAEDVAEIEPLLVTYNDKGEVEGVKYDRIGVVLLNAVKEQQAQIEAREKENEDLKIRIEAEEKRNQILKTEIENQQKQLDEQKALTEALRQAFCELKAQAAICRAKEEKQNEK